MKKTALTNIHISLGAKMAEFAGYEMPIQYSGIQDEHFAVRENAGLFDVSHMGEFLVEGPQALDLIQKVTSNDASKLIPGKAQYSAFINENGGIIDDLIVYCLSESKFLLVVNASNIEKDFNWIQSHNTFDTNLKNISDEISLLALQGPKAVEILKKITDFDIESIKFYHFGIGKVAGFEDVIISGTGYTGSGGFELYFKPDYAPAIWESLMKAGGEMGLKPAGLGARDTLRLEMGYCLYGNDIDDTTNPLEAGLGWITKTQKDFIGKEIILKAKEEGINRKLSGFVMTERGIPRKGYDILNENKEIVGKVTSGTQSPSLKEAIGLGYIDKKTIDSESDIFIAIRNKNVRAKITKPPFVKVN
ncbi:MAG: glycine cleavage system aminomethyltransferase GcvT [Chitinophagaceae bacterium]|nr:MAG: glycine cleavage system aminomethyltransferase GcvT [Chitinophagaceae bacterium]